MFSEVGGIEMEHWCKWVNHSVKNVVFGTDFGENNQWK